MDSPRRETTHEEKVEQYTRRVRRMKNEPLINEVVERKMAIRAHGSWGTLTLQTMRKIAMDELESRMTDRPENLTRHPNHNSLDD